MITPGFSLTATERVLPRLALDFTTGTLDSRITFTRALNTATRVNSSGYIETVNADTPRFDYTPVTLIARGLLIEESRTNTFTYSEEFEETDWTKLNTSVVEDDASSPANTTTADKILDDASNAVHQLTRSVTFAATTAYSCSVFLKAAGRNWAYIQFSTAPFGASTRAWFDLSNGALGSVTNCTATITSFGNGWYRCAISATSTVGGAGVAVIGMTTSNATTTYAGSGTDGFYAWGGQLEVGAFPTSYIPTTSSSLTRNADVAKMTGTNFSDWYNATEGAFVAQTAFVGTAASRSVFYADDNTTNNYIGINTTASSVGRGSIAQSGSPQASVSNGSAITAGATAKIGISYKTNNIYVSSNGAAASQDTSATIPTITQLQFSTFTGGSVTSQWLAKLNYYSQWLTSAEIRAFTK